jgi:hypothetical protein
VTAPAGTVPVGAQAPPRPLSWLVRRLFPVLATIGLVAIGMAASSWWGPRLAGKSAWSLPDDLWSTLVAAQRLWHLHLGGLYTPPTALVGFPGAAVILVPLVALLDAAGLSLRVQGPHNPHPAAWLAAGPYQTVISAVALLAADAIAEQLGVSRPWRALLAAAGAVALWGVSVRWGHPEDAVAVGLLLFAVLALSRAQLARSAWLIGAAAAVQPLVLLALPVIAMAIRPGRLPGYLARAGVPGAVLLGAAAAANWSATVSAVTRQPNWPRIDHPTPWMFLAPQLGHGAVASGPARALAIGVACGCAVVAGRGWRAERDGAPWSPAALRQVLWWVGVTLALRSVFEPVMVAYYLWPVLTVALVTAARSWSSLSLTALVAKAITFAAQLTWHGQWTWWTPMVAGLAVTLYLARPRPAPAAAQSAFGEMPDSGRKSLSC